MEFTTMERLQMKASGSYGVVLKYCDRVFVSDCHHKCGFTADIYEMIDDPEETGIPTIECRLALIQTATERFIDNGHAIAWCMSQK